MAKKKIKKPVSKRTTRATLDERNKRLGKTDAPKARKPRAKKPESVVTTEPAVKTLWREGSVEEFLADYENHGRPDPTVVSQVVSWTPPAPEIPKSGSAPVVPVEVEWTRVSKNGWSDAAGELYDDFISRMKKSDYTTKVFEFAFSHPLIFGISFCTALTAVAVGVAVLARYFRW
jgi:hypothetical protein